MRIGNLVKTCTPNQPIMIPTLVAEVHGVYFGMVKFGKGPHAEPWEIHQNHVSGIPLTVPWLERIGFKRLKGVVAKLIYENPHYVKDYGLDMRFVIEQDHNGIFLFQQYTPLNHVHQLQNLFFAVTGEEIEIPEKEAGVICRI